MQLTLPEEWTDALDEAERMLAARKTERYQYCPIHRLPHALAAESSSPSCSAPDEIALWSYEQAQRVLGSGLKRACQQAMESERDLMALMARRRTAMPWVLYIPPHTVLKTPIQIHTRATWEHLMLLVGQQSEVKIELCRSVQQLGSLVLDVRLDEGASLQIQELDQGADAYGFSALRGECKSRARLKWTGATQGGGCIRWDLALRLTGVEAEADVAGLWALQSGAHGHAHVLIEHMAPHCSSHQLFKGLIPRGGVASFSGLIDVDRLAQKTMAYQLHQSLLLHPSARAYSKPSLDIRADDVKASHGSTTGHLEREHLFYLQSRGLDLELGQRLLAQAFMAPLLARLPTQWHAAFSGELSECTTSQVES